MEPKGEKKAGGKIKSRIWAQTCHLLSPSVGKRVVASPSIARHSWFVKHFVVNFALQARETKPVNKHGNRVLLSAQRDWASHTCIFSCFPSNILLELLRRLRLQHRPVVWSLESEQHISLQARHLQRLRSSNNGLEIYRKQIAIKFSKTNPLAVLDKIKCHKFDRI